MKYPKWNGELTLNYILKNSCCTLEINSHDRQAGADPSLRTNLILDLLNLVKIGIIYSLFLEAFKLGS